jgi:hypothetical protein
VAIGTDINKIMGDFWIIVNNVTREKEMAKEKNCTSDKIMI